jgi:N-glycosylase/DNA lyase
MEPQTTRSDVIETLAVEHLVRGSAYLEGAIDNLLAVQLLHEGNREHWPLILGAYLEDAQLQTVLSPFARVKTSSRFARLAQLAPRQREEVLAPILSRLLPDASLQSA